MHRRARRKAQERREQQGRARHTRMREWGHDMRKGRKEGPVPEYRPRPEKPSVGERQKEADYKAMEAEKKRMNREAVRESDERKKRGIMSRLFGWMAELGQKRKERARALEEERAAAHKRELEPPEPVILHPLKKEEPEEEPEEEEEADGGGDEEARD